MMMKTSYLCGCRVSVVLLLLVLFVVVSTAWASTSKAPLSKMTIGVLEQPSTCTERTAQGDRVRVHYTGTLLSNGQKFDSSLDRGEPFEFKLGAGQVIQCWDRGMLGHCVGTKLRLKCPSSMAYGDRAMGSAIPANSDLQFDVQVVGIVH